MSLKVVDPGGRRRLLLRLEALGIDWPVRELAPLFAQLASLDSASMELATRLPGVESLSPDQRAARQYQQARAAVVGEIRAIFARANGWRVSPTWFSLEQLGAMRPGRTERDHASLGSEFDHADFYRTSQRRPAAITVHNYNAAPPLTVGLRIARLPISWYARATTAYVIVPTGQQPGSWRSPRRRCDRGRVEWEIG